MTKGLYRDYARVILSLEPRFSWTRLDRAQFRSWAQLLGVLAVLAGALTWSRLRVLENGYQIIELRQQRDRIRDRVTLSERRLVEAHSLEAVERVARQRLGMVDMNPNRVVVLRGDGKLGTASKVWRGVKGLFGGGQT